METPEKGTPTDPSIRSGGPKGTKELSALPASTFAAPAAPAPAANPLAPLLAPQKPAAPEFSIVICSSSPARDQRFQQVEAIYKQMLMGEDYEIIRISDPASMAEGYQRGLERSTGRIVIFSHDDAAPVRPFAARLRSHLRRVDIVGGAGTDRLDGPAWFTAGPPHVFGQVLNNVPVPPGGGHPFMLSVYGVPARLVPGIVAFDGFWFAANRDAALAVGFDAEMCDTFHMYDVDFSFRAYLAGFKVGVACDLSLMHASTGGYGDPKWRPQADKWWAKYGHLCPAHKSLGFQMAAVSGGSAPELLAVMDEFVARAEE